MRLERLGGPVMRSRFDGDRGWRGRMEGIEEEKEKEGPQATSLVPNLRQLTRVVSATALRSCFP